MKIALCLFRSIEGAGITQYTRQLSEFLTKNDVEHKIYVLDDKKWPRANCQSFPPYIKVNKENINTIYKELNAFDIVFINSVPSTKHSQWAIDGFLQLVKNLTTKKIVFQNDHKIASIHRNANFFEICNLCDGIVSHSITSPFYNKLVSIFGEEIKDKFIQLHVGFDFTPLEKYRKENHYKKITYLGRYATFKQPDRLFGFLPYAKENSILLEMKGVERSIGSLNIFYENIEKRIPNSKIHEMNKKALENGLAIDNDKRDFDHIYVFGPYNYEDGMEGLSNSLCGADFYHLDKDAYGNNFEYAQCEIVGIGCIPMFDYHFGENCYVFDKNGNNTGKRFIDLDTYGLFVKKDLSNVPETIDKINLIYSNKALKKKYLECSFEITRDHCDSEWIFSQLLNDISKIQKTKVKSVKALF